MKQSKLGFVFKAIGDGIHDRSAYTDEAFRKRGCEIIDAAWDD